VAKDRSARIDPAWPHIEGEKHPVSELATDVQGALSPFGDIAFPLDAESLPYTHPVTEINR
jgi:hypothetical protein